MPETVVPKAKAPLPRPPLPYPQRLEKQKKENQFKKFIYMMKSLSINVPLMEALEQMSGYAKFMKDLMTKKRSMDYETIKMTHQVNAIVHSMTLKLEDPGAFTIPCTIGSADFAKALWELTFRVGDEKVVFHVCKSMKHPNSSKVCSFVDLVMAVIVDDTSAMINVEDPLEAVDTTLVVLQKRKKAIEWTLADIRGISPIFCMQKIILEDDAKPSLEHQRRLHEAISFLKRDKMKYLHDKYARSKEFKVRDLVLLFNSRLRLFSGKLKSKWSGPFEVVVVTPFGAFDLKTKNGEVFRVNGHRVKHYDSHVVALIDLK
ncbi:uncharacterized protein [Nicotiana sylvestris]|uniref:uncharacterized protein n=1 Tax=Nicotiana sylvestris TaxID=4096 RepID=UPI00388C971E